MILYVGEVIGFRLFRATGCIQSSIQFTVSYARGYLAWTLLGIIFFLRSLYYEGEVIGFRLFRATGLAFAIRPKDGVAYIYYKW